MLLDEPNFVVKIVNSKIIRIFKLEDNKVLKNKIILIDAQTGFDWVFSHKITGLITKFVYKFTYGYKMCWAQSSRLGVGEKIFQNLLQSSRVYLDPKNKILRPIWWKKY